MRRGFGVFFMRFKEVFEVRRVLNSILFIAFGVGGGGVYVIIISKGSF